MTQHNAPLPHLSADLDWCLTQTGESAAGAVWRLTEPDRQLDANLIRLPPDHRIELHREPDLDVLLLPIAGHGTLETDEGPLPLTAHALMWLPRTSHRAITAGPEGITYLTVHQKRAGLRIRLPEGPETRRLLEAREHESEGGEAACMLPRLCPKCGAPGEAAVNHTCTNCGTVLTH